MQEWLSVKPRHSNLLKDALTDGTVSDIFYSLLIFYLKILFYLKKFQQKYLLFVLYYYQSNGEPSELWSPLPDQGWRPCGENMRPGEHRCSYVNKKYLCLFPFVEDVMRQFLISFLLMQ